MLNKALSYTTANEVAAVIFDMDGVIIHSEKFWQQAEKEIFSSLGVNMCKEDMDITKSMTTEEVTRFWFKKNPWSNYRISEVEELVVLRVIELIKSTECTVDGVCQFLNYLKQQNLKIGLATNSPKKIINIVLEKLGIGHIFDAICSSEDEKKGKPDSSVYLTASAKLNTLPKYCLAIEDSYSGILAAKNAGMKVAFFSTENTNLPIELADYKVESFLKMEINILLKTTANCS